MMHLTEAIYEMSIIVCSEPAASTAKTHIFIFIINKKRKSEIIEPGNKNFWFKQNFHIVNGQF